MAATETHWRVKGDYFENCNCDVVCPCLFSAQEPMTSTPTQGACEVPFAFHVDEGHFGDTPLDGLNVVAMLRTPGPMGEGNATVALYLDERADDAQRDALQAIFGGSAGGPMGLLAPLVGEVLGVTTAPISYTRDGNRRSAEIPGVAQLAVRAAPSIVPGEPIWASNAHPFAPGALALAVGEEGSTIAGHGMRWDNSGKNGHFAPIDWSNG
ncbi:hypothetical protein Gocc_1480 [Gaiella occulta]|uniref:DUF1326 domain-containing protein n=1 Tax=Gaiella occulta TaxID=1002870 RepID=A0A7M2YWT5_9ACTN|nr:DUF1326 domain-containing protein [Gaiella occulta]RDI74591.1 hypothetical protein Gocc_1480 [Gaiella occulta]